MKLKLQYKIYEIPLAEWGTVNSKITHYVEAQAMARATMEQEIALMYGRQRKILFNTINKRLLFKINR